MRNTPYDVYALNLTDELRVWVTQHTPAGGRLILRADGGVTLRCGGVSPDLTHRCASKYGHTGGCFSEEGNTHFTRRP